MMDNTHMQNLGQRKPFRLFHGVVGWAAMFAAAHSLTAQVVINEIHYHPPDKTEKSQFVELYNAGDSATNLAGWALGGDVAFTFPAGSTLAAGGYAVIAQDPAALKKKYNVTATGQFTGRLSARNGVVRLLDATGQAANEVDYQTGFPWPTVGDLPGYSIELINPALDNSLGGSWRASTQNSSSSGGSVSLIASNSVWHYFKGTAEPPADWRQLAFDDSAWLTGSAPIGYDRSEYMGTSLDDMRGNYTSVYFRKTFVVADPGAVATLAMQIKFDDGFNIWINGQHLLNQYAPSDAPAFDDLANTTRESGSYDTYAFANAGQYLNAGTNVIAVHLLNMSLTESSDCFLDLSLTALSGAAAGDGPTPGRRNAVYATNAPPQIRQVAHHPETPASGQEVRITAKVADPQEVASVTLAYQIVDPGNYIEKTDAAYEANWTQMAMNDDGLAGDEVAGDQVYTAILPAELQVHRRLVRYRVSAQDTLGVAVTVPYADDPQPNFAYFVYDGVPAWRGAIEPGSSVQARAAVVEYDTNVMSRLPVYHLISKKTSVENSTWHERYGGDLYKWSGTLVYDGKVYDHIHYRARGGGWRYAMVKNMWKFDFNRGHDFQARDDYGDKYATKWTKLNLGACIQQGDYYHRGEQGMFEAVGWRLFNMAGIEASKCNWIQFRVIDSAEEASGTDQYEGDFWGLYLALEQMDGRMLDEHGLPDGNLYKMEWGWGTLNNQGANSVTDSSDLSAFMSGYQGSPTDAWWMSNFDRARYYNFRTIIEAIHHYDIDEGAGKNYFYYRNPETGLWSIHPWDLDLTWADNMYGGGVSPFKNRVLNRAAFSLEYRNRIRELRDLLFNAEQTGRLIDECAAMIYDSSGGPCIAGADRAMWDYNPKMSSSAYSSSLSKAGKGMFYQFPTQTGITKSFLGTIQLMKKYVDKRGAVLDSMANDTAIPATPVVASLAPTNFPANQLQFQCSAYSGAGAFAAMQWRLAEVTPATQLPGGPGATPFKYEINALADSGELTTFQEQWTAPASVVKVAHIYRVRARFKDATGRWGHWSSPVEFTVGEPDTAAQLAQDLKLTEIMYHSPQGSDYDFLELHNASSTRALSLEGASFVKGIDYIFGPNAVIPPDGYLVLIKNTNTAAFGDYYSVPTGAVVVGPYDGNLDNGGEGLTLKSLRNGTVIMDFTYRDARGWPAAADGTGHSLVPVAGMATNSGSLAYGGNWRASAYFKGSPGAADPEPAGNLRLNEVALGLDAATQGWVELYNPAATTVAFDNCFLSDDPADLFKWPLPSGSLAPGQWFRLGASNGLALPVAGGTLYLSCFPGGTQNRLMDTLDCKTQLAGTTWGCNPDGSDYPQLLQPTPGAANVPQTPAVLISQIMFRPVLQGATNLVPEGGFVTLRNPGSSAVTLSGAGGAWRLDGDISYMFPTNAVLAAGASLCVVGFDPADTTQLAAFKTQYGLGTQTLNLMGPYNGALNFEGGRITLESPLVGNAGQAVGWAIVDEAIYSAAWPWPAALAQPGMALQRISLAGSGADPARWALATPSFGETTPPTLQLQIIAAASEFRLRATGATAGQIVIERSANCADWTPVFTNAVADGIVEYGEAVAAELGGQYYRARWLP